MAARTCPMCGKTAERAPESVQPFCSPTCKLVDLGRWLDGSYRMPGAPLELEMMGDDGAGFLGGVNRLDGDER